MKSASTDTAALLALCAALLAGIYHIAGHEVARAFALTSTELSDCTDHHS